MCNLRGFRVFGNSIISKKGFGVLKSIYIKNMTDYIEL